MELLSSEHFASKWSLSTRRVNILCKNGRIPGAVKVGGRWFVPETAEKPKDARKKRFPAPDRFEGIFPQMPQEPDSGADTLTAILPNMEQPSDEILVRDLFTLGFFQDWKLVGGKAGIYQPITSLNMMESPDIANWTVKGQLIVSTGYCIRDDVNIQKQIILDLSHTGCAGLAIKMMRFFRTMPKHMIDVANECGLPLIEIPGSYNISEVMNAVAKKIYARRLEKLELSYGLFTSFTESAFHNESGEIEKKLGTLLNAGIIVSDNNWSRINCFVPEDHTLTEEVLFRHDLPVALADLPQGRRPYRQQIAIGAEEYYRYIFRIGTTEKPRGFLSLWTKWKDLTGNELLAVENATAVIYLSLTEKSEEQENLYSQRDIFLIDEYFDRVQSENVALRRALSCGLNPTAHYRAMAVKQFQGNGTVCEISKTNVAVAREIVRRCGACIFQIDNFIVLLCQQADDADNREIENLIREFRTNIRLKSGWLGFFIGNPHRIIKINQSFAQTREAAALYDTQAQKRPDPVLYYRDYRIPAALITLDKKKQEHLHRHVISNLEKYDREHNSSLIETLDCYIRSNMNMSQTSRELFIHRNTLLFRLEKIQELIDMRFSDPDDLLSIQLALRLREYTR